ncbi:MAG: hypothetical protein DRO88_13300 [Promethearchaeia archaeon]|nr:MAG: hypothetical protein DRO88_13300 [Candidatus Lokiarchaeia archaeon]
MASEIDSSEDSKISDRIVKRPLGELISYSLSVIIMNMLFFVFGRVQLFYTEVVGLRIGIYTVVSTIYMIYNMINDPLEGYLADRSPAKFTRKFGKRAPFALIGYLGLSLAIILPFIVIGDVNTNPTGVAIWLCVALCIFDTFVSLTGITMPGLFADKYRDPTQRKLAGILNVVFAIIGMIFSIIAFPTIKDGLAPVVGEQTAWLIGAAIMGGGAFVVSLFLIPGIREDETLKIARAKLDEEKDIQNFFIILWKFIKGRDFVTYLLSILLYGTSTSLIIVALDYWVLYGLGLTLSDTMIPMIAFMLTAPLVSPFWFWLSKKFSSRKVNIIGFIGFGLSVLLFLFVKDMTGTIIVMVISGFTSAAIGVNQNAITSDVLDETAVVFKAREEGSISGVITLFSRLQLLIIPLVFGIVQGATGWVAGSPTQTNEAIFGIRIEMAIVPSALLILAGILFAVFYKITPEKAKENQQKMKELGF